MKKILNRFADHIFTKIKSNAWCFVFMVMLATFFGASLSSWILYFEADIIWGIQISKPIIFSILTIISLILFYFDLIIKYFKSVFSMKLYEPLKQFNDNLCKYYIDCYDVIWYGITIRIKSAFNKIKKNEK